MSKDSMLSDVDYEICCTQGRIYEYAANLGYDMELFSNEYLKSDFCRRAMDTDYSRFQFADEEECWDFIIPEIGSKLEKIDTGLYFDPDVAHWIGFTYRQICFDRKVCSKDLPDKISFETMCRYYPGLHTIDEDAAMDIIRKDKFNE